MIIKQTSLSLVYPKIDQYRKKFVMSEDVLNAHFLPPTILPIPDEVQGEIPRIIVQTKHGHSMLNVALTVASFSTKYDGEFVKDWYRCSSYLNERCSDIYAIIDRLTDDNSTYVGLITDVEFDNLDENGLETLKKSLFISEAKKLGHLYNLSCKLIYIYKERYYINITLENNREYMINKCNEEKSCIVDEQRHNIAVQIDVNDKYASNADPSYKSGKQAFDEILKITSEILTLKLDKLIKEGEFIYDE